MSSFTAPLTVLQKPSGKWRTDREFTYMVGNKHSDEEITVPRGYLTDFFSVPLPFRGLLPKSQKGNQAAVLHDYMYQNHLYSRKKCDDIFLEAMTVLGVSVWKRQVMYRAVRMFGWYGWNKRKKELAKNE